MLLSKLGFVLKESMVMQYELRDVGELIRKLKSISNLNLNAQGNYGSTAIFEQTQGCIGDVGNLIKDVLAGKVNVKVALGRLQLLKLQMHQLQLHLRQEEHLLLQMEQGAQQQMQLIQQKQKHNIQLQEQQMEQQKHSLQQQQRIRELEQEAEKMLEEYEKEADELLKMEEQIEELQKEVEKQQPAVGEQGKAKNHTAGYSSIPTISEKLSPIEVELAKLLADLEYRQQRQRERQQTEMQRMFMNMTNISGVNMVIMGRLTQALQQPIPTYNYSPFSMNMIPEESRFSSGKRRNHGFFQSDKGQQPIVEEPLDERDRERMGLQSPFSTSFRRDHSK
jgi:hypothetical protein